MKKTDLETARAIDRAYVGAQGAEVLAQELKTLIAASLAMLAHTTTTDAVPSALDRKLTKAANRANETLRAWGY